MKRLKTNIDGGFPLVLDDIRWMQDGMYEALAALGQRMCADGFNAVILQGCEITSDSGTVSVAPGWVYVKDDIAGYVCRVEAHSIQSNTQPTLTGNTIRWSVSSNNYDAAGNKTFYNNTQQQTYQLVKASLIEDADPTNPTYLESVKPVWIDGESGVVQSSLMDGILSVRGEKDLPYTFLIDTLSVNHRPTQHIYIPVVVHGQDTETYTVHVLKISSSGTLNLLSNPGEDHDVILNFSIPIR